MQAVCLLLLLVAGISASPIFKSSSPSGSCGSPSNCLNKVKFGYEPGMSYTYEVTSTVKTTTTSPDSKKAGLQVKATAKISGLQDCELLLQLSNVEITDETGDKVKVSKKYLDDLSLPLRFEWNDGRVGDVCPTDEKESAWSLNFKRSVLSSLQNSMDSLDSSEPTREVDATGDCWAHYEVESSSSVSKIIKWTKNLNQCADRQGGMVATYGVKYTNPMSDINTMPLTEGKQTCKQTIEKRLIKQVECEENLEFLPSRLQEGAVKVATVATIQLKLSGESSEKASPEPSKYVTSLKFDHSYVPANLEGDAKEAEKLLDKMCQGEVVPESGRDYSDLLDILRSLTKEDIAKLYETASKCKPTAKMMQNIIADVATRESARFIVEKVESSKDEKKSLVREDWMASLRGVLNPPVEILEKAVSIVVSNSEYNTIGRAYLGVGSMINNYCMRHHNCENRPEVKSAIQRFVSQLDMCNSGSSDRETVRRALYSLRALGNAGRALSNDAYPQILNKCMNNKALSTEIRLSALSVLRRVPCGHENTQASETLRNIMRDNSDDTEFRSYALVASLRCPCIRDLETIRSIVTDKSTPVNEKFGAFIVSYISRMEESPMAHYWSQEFRTTLGSLMSTREVALLAMKIDAMKTGAAIHRQQFWPKMNAGFMYDMDFIHSDKTNFPNNFRFNLSTAAFGYALNPFEFGIRQEGLESLIESLPSAEVFEKPKDGLLQIPRLNTEKLQPILEKLKMSFFVRIFGSEVRYGRIDKEVVDRLRQRLNDRFNLESLKTEEGRQAAELFVDRALSLPTIAGLPLRLSVRGSYRSHVRPTVNPDAKRDSEGRLTSINLKADVKSGLSIELRTSMAVFLGSRQYGVQAVTRVSSKAEYKPEFIWEGRSLKVKVDMPSKIIRDATVSNEVFIRRDKTEEPLVIDGDVRKAELCTPGKTGIKVCVRSEVPSRWNGIMTPGKLSLSLEKADEKLEGVVLELRANHKLGSDGKIDTIDFKTYVDTPGSSTDRKVLAELTVSRPERQLKSTLETPWKKANLEVKMVGEGDNQEIKATFNVGEEKPAQRTYNLVVKRTSGTVTEGDKKHPKRSVSVEITRSDVDKAILKAKGSVTDTGDLKEVALMVDELHVPNYYTLPTPSSLAGNFGKDQSRGYGFKVKGQLPTRDFETEFGVNVEPKDGQVVYSHRLVHHGKPSGATDDKIDRSLLWEVEYRREIGKILLLKSVLSTTEVPLVGRANHRLVLLVERPTPEDLVTDLEVSVGSGSEVKRFKVAQKLHRQFLETIRSFKYALTVSGFNMIDRTVAISYERKLGTTPTLQIDTEVRRGDIAIYQVSLYYRMDAPGFGELKFRTLCPYSDFLLHGKGVRLDDKTVSHWVRLERNGDLRFNFESKAKIDDEERYVEAMLEVMGLVPITLRSRGRGSPFDGNWKHDAVVAYGPRKLLLGGDVNYQESPKGDIEGVLDVNFYFGTPERMFKQYVNWHRMDRLVKLRGMTELGDDLYKISGELDLAARRHRVLVEGPRSSSEIVFGRLSNQRGYDVTLSYQCPTIELQFFSKAGLDILRSDLAGYFAYKLPSDEVKKMIGFKLGYNADLTEGVDLGLLGAVQVNKKQWFLKSNVTVIPSKLGLSFGVGNGDNFRHMFTIMGSRKWESENVLRLNSELEFHCTGLTLPRLKFESNKKLTWNKDTSRFGGIDVHTRFQRGDRELWYKIKVDAVEPLKGVTVSIDGDSEYTKRTEVKVSYTVSKSETQHIVTVLGNARYGERAGRLRGIFEVMPGDKTGYGPWEVQYNVACYADESEHAEISIRGQYAGSIMDKRFRFFQTVEVRDLVYSINGRVNGAEKKLVELIVNTPHPEFYENIIRVWGKHVGGDTTGQILVKIGPKSFHLSTWRKMEPTSRRYEVKVDVDGRLYALGYTLEHPEEMFSRGEYRLRLRADVPVEGYKTSTVMFWFKPCTKGLKGISAVLGLTDAHPDIKEQRSQLQVAYQIGEEHKGGVMLSARGERNYESKKLFREFSVLVKLPKTEFSVDAESTVHSEKFSGWLEYRSERYGKWRSEWTGSGNVKKAGTAQLELRGKLPNSEEPIVIRLSGDHDDEKKTISGKATTSLSGYERIRVRYTHVEDDEGNKVYAIELVNDVSGRKVEAKLTTGIEWVSLDTVEIRLKLNTPYELIREVEGSIDYRNEQAKRTVEIKFNRNERKYVLTAMSENDQDSVSGEVKLETPFEKAKTLSVSFKRSGTLKDGSKTKATITVNDKIITVESEGQFSPERKFVSAIVKANNEEYKVIVNKKPSSFEIRLPTPWSCTIHYTGEIDTTNNLFFGLQRHHTCSPYSFAGNVTFTMMQSKELVVNLETPFPYFKTFEVAVIYDFDDSVLLLDEKLPPIGLTVTVKREDKSAQLKVNIEPDTKSATLDFNFRDVVVSGNARVGNSDGGNIDFSIKTPKANALLHLKREGPWSKPTKVEAQLSAADLDLFNLNGEWDVTSYPQSYSVDIDGVVYSKKSKLVVSGETESPLVWKRKTEIKFGQRFLKTSVEMNGNKLLIDYARNENTIKVSAEVDHKDDGVKKVVKSTYEVSQTGITTKFSTFKWTSTHSIPSSVNIKSPKDLSPELLKKLISSVEWSQKLVVDGTEKFWSDGKVKVELPRDTTLVGMKFDLEVSRFQDGEKKYIVCTISKPEAGKPTQFKLLSKVNDETKIDLTGSIERREKFLKYFRVKVDVESPKQMSFDVERDGSDDTNRVWKLSYNLDKSVDKQGNQWQMTVKPADGVTKRGADVVITCKRGADDMILYEIGYQRVLSKTFHVTVYNYFKSGNMDKKYGFRDEIEYENQVVSIKTEFTALTRTVKADTKVGYEPSPRRIFYTGLYDLGTPSTKLDMSFELLSNKFSGKASLGDKVVNLDGVLSVTDRHNYELDVKVVDEASNNAHFNFKKTWSEQTSNRTYQAYIKTNKGDVEWFSYRYDGESLRSRSATLRIRKSEWSPSEDIVLKANIETDITAPWLKIKLDTPFHNFQYLVKLERREGGVKNVISRLVGHDGKVSTMLLELDPLNWSFDFTSNRSDSTGLKVHGHIASTKYGFLEAKRKVVDGSFENLVRVTINLEPAQLQANLKYNTKLSEIIREYITRRLEQSSVIVAKYKENIPKGVKLMQEIELFDQLVLPFVKTMRDERLKLEETERSKWTEITKVWYESSEVKSLVYPIRLPEYANSIAARLLSKEPWTALPTEEEMAGDRALLAISQAVRQFIKEDLIPDLRQVRSKEESTSSVQSHLPVTSTLVGVRNTVREFVSLAVQRLRDRTWTSCLIRYVKKAQEKLVEKSQELANREDLRDVHERLSKVVSRVRSYLVDLKERVLSADPKKSSLMSTLRESISKSSIDFKPESGVVDVKVVLPHNELRSLRTPAALARRVETVRELLERGVAAVKARLTSPSSQATVKQVLGLLQYFRVGQLRYLFL